MMFSKLRLLHDWILVEMDPVETQVGSIIVPSGTANRKATVLEVGPGREQDGIRQPVGVEPGDRVIFHRAHGEHKSGKRYTELLGANMLFIQSDDVLLVFSGELVVS